MSPDDGAVFPVDFSVAGHGREDSRAYHVFGDQSEAGGVTVKAVTAAERKRDSLLLVIPDQGVGQGVSVIVHGGVHRHTGGFVDEQDVLIFIENRQRKLHRRNQRG